MAAPRFDSPARKPFEIGGSGSTHIQRWVAHQQRDRSINLQRAFIGTQGNGAEFQRPSIECHVAVETGDARLPLGDTNRRGRVQRDASPILADVQRQAGDRYGHVALRVGEIN